MSAENIKFFPVTDNGPVYGRRFSKYTELNLPPFYENIDFQN